MKNILLLALLLFSIEVVSQCDAPTLSGNATNPADNTGASAAFSTIQTTQYAVLTNLITSNSYTITEAQDFIGNVGEPFITIRSTSDNSVIAFGNTPLTFTAPSDQVEVHHYLDNTCASSLGLSLFNVRNNTDTSPPSFENSTPSASSVSQTGFTLGTDIDEAGTIYYVVLNDGATAPSSAQVIAGNDGNDAAGIDSGNQSVSSGGFTHNFNITGLTAGSSYDIYVVAQDDEGSPNVQTSPTLLEVTTTATLTWDGSTDNDWDTASNWTPTTLPGSGTDVVIPTGLTNYPTAGSAVTVNTVSIASGATLIANSTFSGTVTYNRTLSTTNWYLISSPVSGQDIDAFVSAEGLATGAGDNLGFAPYDNNGSAWTYYQNGASGTGNFLAAGGYSVKLSSSGDISFTGSLYTSDQTISITDGSANEFNLVGNPYTSFIAANNNADLTHNVLKVNDTDNDFLSESTLWFWDQANNMYDQINQSSSAFYIAPGQGFFVSANETGAPHSFSITEAMRSHQSSDTFQRTSTTRPEVQLLMTDGTNTRDADIYYIEGTTTGFDNGYDSSIFGGVTHSFAVYTQAVANSQGRQLGIQSLPTTDLENMIIPVGVISDDGTLTFTVKASNLPTGYKVFLEDKETGNFIRLDENGSTYEVTLDQAIQGIGRFFLHTTTSTLTTGSFDADHISAYISFKDNLKIVGIQHGSTHVRMFDIVGKQVLKTSFQGNGVNDVSLPNLRPGVYVVQIATVEGRLTKKIVIE